MKYFFEAKGKIEMEERSSLDFPAHLHENFEVGYVQSGEAVLVVDDNKYTLCGGDFFVIFPNQIHSYENSHSCIAKVVIFSPLLIGEFEKIFSSKLPENPVISQSEFGRDIINMLFDVTTDNVNVLKGFLLALFGILMDNTELKDVDKYNVSTLENLLIYCSEHFSEGITISDVSENLHISRYHIAHIFREKLKTTFSDYITAKRIEYACQLLRDRSMSVVDVAYQSGFNSIRSFNRNFLKHMGVSPKEYRKQKAFLEKKRE